MPASQTTNFHQRMTLAIVGLFAVLTLVFGVLSIKKSIVVPFFRKPGGPVFKTQDQLEKEQLALLKTRDTDSDTLTDYDELYIYRTSPYLADSDSDGISDAVEIARGSDPNCPAGQTCRVPRSDKTASGQVDGQANTGSPTAVDTVLGAATQPDGTAAPATGPTDTTTQKIDPAAQLILETFGDISQLTTEQAQEKISKMTTEQLRAFFINLGLPKDKIDKVSDDDLRAALLETTKEALKVVNTTQSIPTP